MPAHMTVSRTWVITLDGERTDTRTWHNPHKLSAPGEVIWSCYPRE